MKNILKKVVMNFAKEDIIKKHPEKSFNALLKKLEGMLKDSSDKAMQGLLTNITETLRAMKQPPQSPFNKGELKAALDAVNKYIAAMPEDAAASLKPGLYAVTKEIWTAGFSLVSLETGGVAMAFNLKDLDAIAMTGRHNLFWVKQHYDEITGEKLNSLLKDMFETGYTREELAKKIKETFQPIIKEEQRYFEGLADHIASKTKEMGRISGYERRGIKYVKVKAILDSKTSQICRSMHGRIISVESLAAQRDAILSASSKDELKAAQKWLPDFQGKTKDMPAGLAGPPYHYRCRTTTAAYFEELAGESAGDETYQYFDGKNTRKEKVLFRYHDKESGRELVLTEGAEYALKHLPMDKIKAAMRSITHYGVNARPDAKGQLVTLSQNDVFLAFRDNVVYNAYINPKSPKKYFNRASIGGVRKWAERLRRIFIAYRHIQ